ncbi:hypothetical protein V6Z11_D11G109600 [Gossypium hirsutum]
MSGVLMHTNLVKTPLETESGLSDVRGGCSCGLGFHPRIWCQICNRYGHLVQRCFYRFNCEYSSLTTSTVARFSSAHTGQEMRGGRYAGFVGPGQYGGPTGHSPTPFSSGAS